MQVLDCFAVTNASLLLFFSHNTSSSLYKMFCSNKGIKQTNKQLLQVFYFLLAVYKTGMGRKGQERWDVWGDLGLGDIKYGRRGRQIQGCGDIND